MTTTAQTVTGTGGERGRVPPRATPPEWAAERAVKWVGRVPAALGRTLDKAAKVPVAGWVVRRLSSVWLGIILLALIGAYIAIGSGFPGLRARFEMTDLQFFDAWPMRVLLVLLSADLILVTLRKIPFTLFKLGPWIVHTGILTLIGGCVWYFSMKQEGATRFYLNKPTTAWYDTTERALYAYPVKPDGSFDLDHVTITAMPGTPIYDEHIEGEGHHNPLDMLLKGAVGSGAAALNVHVGGYYPCAELKVGSYHEAAPGEEAQGPAIAVSFGTPRDAISEQWLQSDTRAGRLQELQFKSLDTAISVEFLNRPPAQRVKDLQTQLTGPVGLIVRVPKLKVERVYTLTSTDPIVVEGTPYTLTPGAYNDMPMRSVGYEDTHSSNLMISVSRKDAERTFAYQRMCVSRYPERSPDFVMENGKQTRKQEGVDPDIDIVFLDGLGTNAWIIEGDDGKLSTIVRTPDGKAVTMPVTDSAIPMPVKEIPDLQMRVTGHTEKSIGSLVPVIVPKEQRRQGQTVMDIIAFSAIDMDILLPGGGNVAHVYVPFVPYGEVAGPEGVKPTVVNVPGWGRVGFVMSTVRRSLPTPVTLVDFKPVKYPGAVRSYDDYVSTLKFADTGTERVSHLNKPVYDKGLIYFQSQWDGDPDAPPEKRFSVMGVANRPGMMVMVTGAILIAIGIGYAFYAKPILLKYKKETLARWNEAMKAKDERPKTKDERPAAC